MYKGNLAVSVCDQVGESFVSDDCSEKCFCPEPKADLECTKQECPENQECVLKDGFFVCECQPPFAMVDGACKGTYSWGGGGELGVEGFIYLNDGD